MSTRPFTTCTCAALLLVLGAASCDSGSSAPADASRGDAPSKLDAGPPDGPPAPDGEPSKAVRVLFVGNSYTSTNNLPSVLAKLGSSPQSPMRFVVARHTPGGATWEQHNDSATVDGLIQQGWDFVVLQDQSGQPLLVNEVKKALVALDGKIRAAGARTVLFMTWAHDVERSQVLWSNFWVHHYYEMHAAAVDATVAPVGRAWERALRDPDIVLHQSDGSHPNEEGTYLAACVFYATLTGESPVGLGGGGLSISGETAAALQKVAAETMAARERPARPLVGSWPLSAAEAGNDLIPGPGTTLGDTAGPGSTPGGATRLGGEKTVIALVPGAPPKTATLSLYVHRQDWSSPAGQGGGNIPKQPKETIVSAHDFEIELFSGQLHFRIFPAGTTPAPELVYPVQKLAPGWHHLAVAYDGTTWGVWIDGVLAASASATGDLGTKSTVSSLSLGVNSFTGALARVELYAGVPEGYALTP